MRRSLTLPLDSGPDAFLSHTSAAILWKLLKPIDGPVHVSIPATSGRKRRRGIHLHRTPSLHTPAEPSPSPSSLPIRGGRGRRLLTTHRHRIPVTTVPRTIEDLEGYVSLKLYRRAKRQAELIGHHLEGVESDHTRSDLETLFLEIRAQGALTAFKGGSPTCLPRVATIRPPRRSARGTYRRQEPAGHFG